MRATFKFHLLSHSPSPVTVFPKQTQPAWHKEIQNLLIHPVAVLCHHENFQTLLCAHIKRAEKHRETQRERKKGWERRQLVSSHKSSRSGIDWHGRLVVDGSSPKGNVCMIGGIHQAHQQARDDDVRDAHFMGGKPRP